MFHNILAEIFDWRKFESHLPYCSFHIVDNLHYFFIKKDKN